MYDYEEPVETPREELTNVTKWLVDKLVDQTVKAERAEANIKISLLKKELADRNEKYNQLESIHAQLVEKHTNLQLKTNSTKG